MLLFRRERRASSRERRVFSIIVSSLMVIGSLGCIIQQGNDDLLISSTRDAENDIQNVKKGVTVIRSQESITIDGTIKVQGSLQLSDVDLIFKKDSEGKSGMIVAKGGKLSVVNGNFSSIDHRVKYNFQIDGEADISASDITDVWGDDENKRGGILISSDDVHVSECLIHDQEIGILVKDAEPSLRGNTIRNCTLGTVWISSSFAGLPDLMVNDDDIIFSNDIPVVGELIDISCRIYNFGNGACTANVRFYDGDPCSGGSLITSKQAFIPNNNEGWIIKTSWSCTAGQHEIHVTVNEDGSIPEKNQDNNVAIKTLVPSSRILIQSTLMEGDGVAIKNAPIEGVPVHVHESSGRDIGLIGRSNSDGEVFLPLKDGEYRFRIDYLNYEFWSGVFKIPGDERVVVSMEHRMVNVSLSKTFNDREVSVPLTIPIRACSEDGRETDLVEPATGNVGVAFKLPNKPFVFRADHASRPYWSAPTTWLDRNIQIPLSRAEVIVSRGQRPVSEARVSAILASGPDINYTMITDPSGRCEFYVPDGEFRFKAVSDEGILWSPRINLRPGQEQTIYLTFKTSVVSRSTSISVYLMNDDLLPLGDETVQVYTEYPFSYTGISGTTNEFGEVIFSLDDGNYLFMTDYLGYEFWSGGVPIPPTNMYTLIIPHQAVAVTVQSEYQSTITKRSGVNVKTYTEVGEDACLSTDTDSEGVATFDLPQQSYKFKCDYLGGTYWSDPVTWSPAVITILEGKIELTFKDSGTPVQGVTANVFSSSGQNLGINSQTNENGKVTFQLPVDDYKIRVDHDNGQYWTTDISVVHDETTPFTLDIQADLTVTLIKCVPTFPSANDATTIKAIIHNAGQKKANQFTVRFYDGNPSQGGTQIDTDKNVASLDGNAETEVSASWTPVAEGTMDLHVVTDATSAITESNENNNVGSKSTRIYEEDSTPVVNGLDIADCTYGLYIEQCSPIIAYSVFEDCDYGIYCIASSPTLQHCSISNPTIASINAKSASKPQLIDTMFARKGMIVEDATSDVTVYWHLTVTVIDDGDDPVDGVAVQLTDANDVTAFDGTTDDEGMTDEILLKELKCDSSGTTLLNPYLLEIDGEIDNELLIDVNGEMDLMIHANGDSDDDGLLDIDENGQHVHSIEAEHLAISSSQIEEDDSSSGGKALVSDASNRIMDSIVTSLDPGTYKCYVKARSDSPGTEIRFDLSSTNGNLVTAEDHTVAESYHWYSTMTDFAIQGANPVELTIELSVADPNPSASITVDKILIAKLKDSAGAQVCKKGQITDPLSEDTDSDGLLDESEVRDDVYWFEAEDFPGGLPTDDDVEASNGKVVSIKNGDNYLIPALATSVASGEYEIRVKLRHEQSTSGLSTVLQCDDGIDLLDIAWRTDGTYSLISRYDEVKEEGSILKFDGTTLTPIPLFSRIDTSNTDFIKPGATMENVIVQDGSILIDPYSFQQVGNYYSETITLTNSRIVTVHWDATLMPGLQDVNVFLFLGGQWHEVEDGIEENIPPGQTSISYRVELTTNEIDNSPSLDEIILEYNTRQHLNSICWKPDPSNSRAIVAADDGYVYEFDHATQSFVEMLSCTPQKLVDAEWRPDGAYAMLISQVQQGERQIIKYDGSYFTTAGLITTANPNAMSWKPDEDPNEPGYQGYLLIAGDNGLVVKWSGTTQVLDEGIFKDLNDVDWCDDGNFALFVGEDGNVIKMDASLDCTQLMGDSSSTDKPDFKSLEMNPISDLGTTGLIGGENGQMLFFEDDTITPISTDLDCTFNMIGGIGSTGAWSVLGTGPSSLQLFIPLPKVKLRPGINGNWKEPLTFTPRDTYDWYSTIEFDASGLDVIKLSIFTIFNAFDTGKVYLDKIVLLQLKATTSSQSWTVDTGGEVTAPAIGSDCIIIGMNKDILGQPPIHKIIAYHGSNGALSWEFTDPNIQSIVSCPMIYDGMVYFVSDQTTPNQGKLHALDEDTGNELWSIPLNVGGSCAPAISDEYIAFTSNDHVLHVNDRESGIPIWSTDDLTYDITTSPVISKDRIFIGFEMPVPGPVNPVPVIIAYDLTPPDDEASQLWTWSWQAQANPVSVTATPLVVDGLLIFPASDNNVHALSVWDGTEVWSNNIGQAMDSSPACRDTLILIGANDGHLYALNENDGTTAWSEDLGDLASISSPAVAGNQIIVAKDNALAPIGHRHLVFNLESSSGDEIWKYDFSDNSIGKPSVIGDIDSDGELEIIVGAGTSITVLDGGGSCIRGANPWPLFHEDEQNSGNAQYDPPHVPTDPLDDDTDGDGLGDAQETGVMWKYERIESHDMYGMNRIGAGAYQDTLNNQVTVNIIDHQFSENLTATDHFDNAYLYLPLYIHESGEYHVIAEGSGNVEFQPFKFILQGGQQIEVPADGEIDVPTLNAISAEKENDILTRILQLELRRDTLNVANPSQNHQPVYNGNLGTVLPQLEFLDETKELRYATSYIKRLYPSPSNPETTTIVSKYWHVYQDYVLGKGTHQVKLKLDTSFIDQIIVPFTAGGKDYHMKVKLVDVSNCYILVEKETNAALDPDMDNDYITDGVEVDSGWSPLNSDIDEDGISDFYEAAFGLNPELRDSDSDGLRDRVERGTHALDLDPCTTWDGQAVNQDTNTLTQTDPKVQDSDGDGLPDGVVETWGMKYERYKPNYDTWGLHGKYDWQGGWIPASTNPWEGEDFNLNGKIDNGETDPKDDRSDDDVMPDGYERWFALDPNDAQGEEGDNGDVDVYDAQHPSYFYYTKPWDYKTDSNPDALSNKYEYIAGTNPMEADTDRDGLIDGGEVPVGKSNLMDPVVFRTNVEKGAFTWAHYGAVHDSGGYEWVWVDGIEYGYSQKKVNIGKSSAEAPDQDPFNGGVPTNMRFVAFLEDKTAILCDDGAVYVWAPNSLLPSFFSGWSTGDVIIYSWASSQNLGESSILPHISYIKKEQYFCDPLALDSDNDRRNDGTEISCQAVFDQVNNKYVPEYQDTNGDETPDGYRDFDADQDGWGNARDIDSDDDEIADRKEVPTPVGTYTGAMGGTNPYNEDTDGDGWDDTDDVLPKDLDNDGLTGWIEFTDTYGSTWPEFETSSQEDRIGTESDDPDSDGDGLLDGPTVTIDEEDIRHDDFNTAGILHETGTHTYNGEPTLGTDPTKPDTDGDGIDDGTEWKSDYDSQTTGKQSSSPLNPDSDGDGAPDGWVDGWIYSETKKEYGKYGTEDGDKDSGEYEDKNCDGDLDAGETSPIVNNGNDDDDDEVDNWYEIKYSHWNSVLKLDYDDPNTDDDSEDDGDEDFDGDGLITSVECDWQTHPYVDDSEDTDDDEEPEGDGMPDKWEVDHGLRPTHDDADDDNDGDGLDNIDEHEEGTDPKNPDCDGDGLEDGEEVNTRGTDPLNPDTDLDLIKDGDEEWTETLTYNLNEDATFVSDDVKAFPTNAPEISVAIDYWGNPPLSSAITITSSTPGIYVISCSKSDDIKRVVVHIKYTAAIAIPEQYLAMYWNGATLKLLADSSIQEWTDVDRENDYVWGYTNKVGTVRLGDLRNTDMDSDGLADNLALARGSRLTWWFDANTGSDEISQNNDHGWGDIVSDSTASGSMASSHDGEGLLYRFLIDGVGPGTYRYYIKMRCDATIAPPQVYISFNTFETCLSTGTQEFVNAFFITPTSGYRWYSLEKTILIREDINDYKIKIAGVVTSCDDYTISAPILVDKVLLVRIDTNNPIIASRQMVDPSDPDIDGDGVTNAQEVHYTNNQPDLFWYEAEDYCPDRRPELLGGQVVEDVRGSNGHVIRHLRGQGSKDSNLCDILSTAYIAGDGYRFYARAMSTGPEPYNALGMAVLYSTLSPGYYNIPIDNVNVFSERKYRWIQTSGFSNDNDARMHLLAFEQYMPVENRNYLDKLLLVRTSSGGTPTSINTGEITDPFDPDTDGDGLNDYFEVEFHTNSITIDDTDKDDDGVLDGVDNDPLVNLQLNIQIEEILGLDPLDNPDRPDFYLKIKVSAGEFVRRLRSAEPITHDEADKWITSLDATVNFRVDIPDDQRYINIVFSLFDDDGDTDEHLDITGPDLDCEIVYDTRTATWTGDDQNGDPNGICYSSGNEDGSVGTGGNHDQNDAEIRFNLYQSDGEPATPDLLASWEEVYVFHTDPIQDNMDSDGDGINAYFERRYAPANNPSHTWMVAGNDEDNDHLNNLAEFQHQTNPLVFELNLVVALDWDAGNAWLDELAAGLRSASDYLYDITDSLFYFRVVHIWDNRNNGGGDAVWNDADIRIQQGTADDPADANWPRAHVGAYLAPPGRILLPELFDSDGVGGDPARHPNHAAYFRTMIHECGHYIFGLWDEYIDNAGNAAHCTDDRNLNACFMDYHYDQHGNEICIPTNHDLNADTMQEARNGESCWETIFDNYFNRMYMELDYNGARDWTFPNNFVLVDSHLVTVAPYIILDENRV